MIRRPRRNHSPAFKVKAALAAALMMGWVAPRGGRDRRVSAARLNKMQVLELARCEWIDRRENVIALGL